MRARAARRLATVVMVLSLALTVPVAFGPSAPVVGELIEQAEAATAVQGIGPCARSTGTCKGYYIISDFGTVTWVPDDA